MKQKEKEEATPPYYQHFLLCTISVVTQVTTNHFMVVLAQEVEQVIYWL